ncbi:hypothetical protein [Echinicola rosea]|nr:hypothetical protein [Echinicola rosea]
MNQKNILLKSGKVGDLHLFLVIVNWKKEGKSPYIDLQQYRSKSLAISF